MAGKITGVNVDGQVYEFVAGQAVTGACSALSTDWVKPLTLPEGTDLVGGLIISVLFLNGNSVGFKGAKTVYSSDGENFYYDQAMTDPVTLPPEGCYSMTLVSGDEYSFSAWPVMTYGGITLPICDSRGYKAGGPLWDAGDTVSIIFYATGYVILAGGEGISMEVYPTLADAQQDLPNLDEGQFIATEEGDNFTVVDVVQKDIPNPVSSNAVAQFKSYFTTEHFTGKYWIDGKKIYRKTTVVKENGTMNPNITQSGTTYTIANDYFSQNEETVIKAVAHAKRSTGGWDTIISGSADIYCILISSNSIGFKFSGVTNTYIYVTVEYTKTTD